MNVSDVEIADKNHIYDGAAAEIWRLLVYEPVHGGRRFANIGGASALDFIAPAGALTPRSRVLELCCGLGDTCRYLAERTGCSVVGVDVNARQIEAARQRLRHAPPSRGRVTFVESDVRSLDVDGSFDLVYALDSLALVPQLARLLGAVRRLLRPDGRFAAAEIVAGDRLDDRFRRFAWEQDGIISLMSADEYRGLLADVGFERVVVEPRTQDAARCFRTIWRAAVDRRAEVIAASGPLVLAEWRKLAAAYHRAFRERRLGYAWLQAHAPARHR